MKGTNMNECIFCKIIKKEIPSLTVYEDSSTIAFMELTPSSPGHIMVILKKHGRSMLDYSDADLATVLPVVKKMAKKVQAATGCTNITIGINHLEPTGVPHMHIHLIPRWEDDNGHAIQGVVKKNSKETREAIADKIRKG